jgi:hypothetical protein
MPARGTPYRTVVLLLWALAAYNSFACRGLFWDGAAFLVNVVDFRTFHDFYPARAHVGWVTQLPVLLALRLGVTDMNVLAMIQSAALFALPAGLYQLALARLRNLPVLFATVLAAIAIVYLPTSFFIIGEYNATYAAVTAAMAVLLTSDGSRRDGAILLALGALCLRSYEAMVYLGPLLAAAILWATWWRFDGRRRGVADDIARLLGTVAALAFLGGAVVSGVTMAEYWHHPHFVQVRAAVADFWQNLQFMIPFCGLLIFAAVSLVYPSWLRGRGPVLLIGLAIALMIVLPWVRVFRPATFLFPPSHYVARTAAGCVLWAMLIVMWIHVAGRASSITLLARLREPAVGRRLASAMTVLVLAACVPDIMLTRLWGDYLGYMRAVVLNETGLIEARTLPLQTWPQRLFSQQWSLPALSAVLRRDPANAIVIADPHDPDEKPFDPLCGTLPRLIGYRWPP